MKIALIANTDFGLYNFRLGLMKALLQKGDEVVAIAPDKGYLAKIAREGIKTYSVTIDRKGINPFQDLTTLRQIYRLLKKERSVLVHNFTIKPNIYGNLAARLARIPHIVNSVTGLGYVFSGNPSAGSGVSGAEPHKWLRCAVMFLYRIAFRFSHRVIFQNQDDLELFVRSGIIDRARTVLIKGSGVNLRDFSPDNVNQGQRATFKDSLNITQETITISFIGRLLWHKGIGEFIEAARMIKKKYPETMFLVIGSPDPGNPASVATPYLDSKVSEGIIKYLGWQGNIREILSLSDIVAFPSYYGEGIPRVLLEAMAMQKPIVTTDHPGCRETVEAGKNGFLVPVKDVTALANALEKLILDKDLRDRFGRYSRAKALREFTEEDVISQTIKVYETLFNDCH